MQATKRIVTFLKFIFQAGIYKIFHRKSSFSSQQPTQFENDPVILEAFESNQLSSDHYMLLYRSPFEIRTFNQVVAACFRANKTDIYWGDFISPEGEKATKLALQQALQEAMSNSRLCAFIAVEEKTANIISRYQLPLKGMYIGEEWKTKVQDFDIAEGPKCKNFRTAKRLAAEHNLTLEEIKSEKDLNEINQMLSAFAKEKGLSFPRVKAGCVTFLPCSPFLRRVWKVVDEKGKLISVAVLVKMGKEQYYFEHTVWNKNKLYKFVNDWCVSQILLILKGEGTKLFSWGTVPNLMTDDEANTNPELWTMNILWYNHSFKKFAHNTRQFKQEFIPIEKVPKWFFYSSFHGDLFIDIRELF